jgi:Uma2 family endonuclease
MSIAPIQIPLVLGLEHNGICMTTDEFDAITEYDDLYKYELIHGVVVVNPIPLAQERGPNQELGRLLLNDQESNPQGRALDDTLEEEYVRTAECRRRADCVIWTGLGRQPNLDADVPTIVVEFVSAGRRSWNRDYVEKRDEYLPLGVLEYWVINRFDRTMTVFRNQGSNKFDEKVVSEQQVYQSILLPGFELAIARLFAVADRWNPHR